MPLKIIPPADSKHGQEPAMRYAASAPYPQIRIDGKNPLYARMMLDNIGGSISEMTAVTLYFYDHVMTHEYPPIAASFHQISIVEMRHLEIFSQLALQLGEDPRLWSQNRYRKTYWTPAYLHYSTDIQAILLNAIRSEEAAIAKYESQIKAIQDPNIVENLKRILLDEHLHIEILTRFFRSV